VNGAALLSLGFYHNYIFADQPDVVVPVSQAAADGRGLKGDALAI
jgi:hypothetical protein